MRDAYDELQDQQKLPSTRYTCNRAGEERISGFGPTDGKRTHIGSKLHACCS